jgi:hypothetical protein
MSRRIRITAIRKDRPDVGLYVLALIALARQLQEQEERERAGATATPEPPEGGAHE